MFHLTIFSNLFYTLPLHTSTLYFSSTITSAQAIGPIIIENIAAHCYGLTVPTFSAAVGLCL